MASPLGFGGCRLGRRPSHPPAWCDRMVPRRHAEHPIGGPWSGGAVSCTPVDGVAWTSPFVCGRRFCHRWHPDLYTHRGYTSGDLSLDHIRATLGADLEPASLRARARRLGDRPTMG